MQISQLNVHNFRSLAGVELPLRNLNVVIGPNGSGKTALMEVLMLLSKGARGELSSFFEERGGFQSVSSLVTKGISQGRIGIQVFLSDGARKTARQHDFRVELRGARIGYEVADEYLSRVSTLTNGKLVTAEYFYSDGKLHTTPNPRDFSLPMLRSTEFVLTQLPPEKEFRDAPKYREFFGSIAYFPPLPVSGRDPIRLPQALTPELQPSPTGDNLYSLLYNLRISHPEEYERLLRILMQAFPGMKRLEFPVVGAGMVTLAWYDQFSRQPYYSNQLSEGTIRFLWLATLLLSPRSSSILLLDEPELSLHPELLRLLVLMLQEAALTTQIVVATHSAELISWLRPEEVLIADKAEGQTRFTWADTLNLEKWLAEYTLRDLWLMGNLGGRP